MSENGVKDFLDERHLAVAGASTNREKYGNKVLRCCLQNELNVVAIHPKEKNVEGTDTYRTLSEVPHEIGSLSIITPPQVTEQLVDEAIAKGVRHIWMQPGAESELAINKATEAGLTVIAGGPCILVVLGFRDSQ